MDEFVSFVVENQMLIYAIICLLLLIVLVAFAPRKKKVKEELVDNSPKSTDDLTIEDVTDIVNDDTFIYEKVDIKEEPKVNELDSLLEVMQKDLDAQKVMETSTSDSIDDYEDEQEKTAIISYQELLKAARENKIKTAYDDENAAIMSTRAIEAPEEIVETISHDDLTDTKKFKNSEFISPIFGKQEMVTNYPKISNFKHDEATKKESNININDDDVMTFDNTSDEEFLKTLIDFRNNLQ